MPKLIDVVKVVGTDAVEYFTKNKGVNSTTAATLVGAPALIPVIEQMASGTDMAAAITAGGPVAYLAMAWYGIRFLVYVLNKANK